MTKLNMRYVVGKGIFKGYNFLLKSFSIEIHMPKETLLEKNKNTRIKI
jgi:hypothetical protein